MNNLHPDPLSDLTKDDSKLILGRPISQLLNRLDAVLLEQKTCKMEKCRKPWNQLHRDGQVKDLKDALDMKYDDQYAKYPKVGFERCFLKPIYDPSVEGPQWQGTMGQEGRNVLMRNGYDWDTWA